jgi:hypothetical protein
MISYRTNRDARGSAAAEMAGVPPTPTGDGSSGPRVPPGAQGAAAASPPAPPAGDIIYGAKAIARFLFDDDSNRSRRRVFNLWSHYRDRKEQAGFFKLKGALCLSKSKWMAFHGLL